MCKVLEIPRSTYYYELYKIELEVKEEYEGELDGYI